MGHCCCSGLASCAAPVETTAAAEEEEEEEEESKAGHSKLRPGRKPGWPRPSLASYTLAGPSTVRRKGASGVAEGAMASVGSELHMCGLVQLTELACANVKGSGRAACTQSRPQRTYGAR
jgi:hypothetical protein